MRLSPLFAASLMAAALLSLDAEAQVVWLEKDYDFGLMKEAAGPATGSARFINRGREAVSVTGARPSCGCTSVDYSEEPVAPGDTAVISFTYDPTGRPGKFDKSIRVYIGEHDSYRIGIKGNVLGTPESLEQFYPYQGAALRLSDTVVAAGEMVHGSSRNFFVNAYNQSPDSITPVVTLSDPALKAVCSEKRMGPGDIATFALYFNSGQVKEVGELEIPVVISYEEERTAEPLTVEFRANVTPDFSRLTPEQVADGPRCYLIPERTDLGILSGDRVAEFSCRIQNQGKGKLNVLRISPKNRAVKVKRRPSSVKAGKTDDIRFAISVGAVPSGAFNIPVDIITDDPLHPIRTLYVVGIKE
ncbi:MAG: DUF1573 domain-containing protein [Muribaculaceae bacterium]|nr:DUF1573 domain-containing protein [Muribaculaceae bacterium]